MAVSRLDVSHIAGSPHACPNYFLKLVVGGVFVCQQMSGLTKTICPKATLRGKHPEEGTSDARVGRVPFLVGFHGNSKETTICGFPYVDTILF